MADNNKPNHERAASVADSIIVAEVLPGSHPDIVNLARCYLEREALAERLQAELEAALAGIQSHLDARLAEATQAREREAMLAEIRAGLQTIRERELSGGNGLAVIDALLARLSTEGK